MYSKKFKIFGSEEKWQSQFDQRYSCRCRSLNSPSGFRYWTCTQISLQRCTLPRPPLRPHTYLSLCPFSLPSSPSHLTVGWVRTVSAVKGLCVGAAARVILRGLLCQSQEVWGSLRRSEEPGGAGGPALDWARGPGAGRGPRCWPAARSGPLSGHGLVSFTDSLFSIR